MRRMLVDVYQFFVSFKKNVSLKCLSDKSQGLGLLSVLLLFYDLFFDDDGSCYLFFLLKRIFYDALLFIFLFSLKKRNFNRLFFCGLNDLFFRFVMNGRRGNCNFYVFNSVIVLADDIFGNLSFWLNIYRKWQVMRSLVLLCRKILRSL